MKVDNIKIARIFREIADLLSIKGENPFRIRAYEKAADILEHLSGNIEELYREGKLKQIPGIGKGILEKIETIIKTGTLPLYEQLKSNFPPGLIEIISIPDVGPKTAKLLYEKMGIKNVEELEDAAKKGMLRGLAGMGERKEENILRGIKLYRMRSSRMLLGRALPLVNAVISELTTKASSLIEKISPAGSLRRGKETVGDIDILATSSNPDSLMDAFSNLSFVEEVLVKGETKTSILTDQGFQMDLRVVSSESFGAALQYFTGSKSHNIKLRERAIRKGLKINEYGVFNQEGRKIAGEKEEEVYSILNLHFIPPELREDRGEIEAAEKGSLPDLLTEKDIKGDLHIHTTYSDGKNDIEEMVEGAIAKGYQYIAITDHSSSLKVARGLSIESILSQIKKIKELNSKLNGFKILTGAEVNINKDGSLDFPEEVLSKLDVVIAAIHTGFKQDEKTITNRVIKALRHPMVNILAHPSGRLIGEREPYAIDLNEVLNVAAEEGVWVEINSQPERLDLTDYWAMEAKKKGVKIVINTDSHNKDSLDFIKLGVVTARRGWLEKGDVVNTLSLHQLLKLLQDKKLKGGYRVRKN
ncbi:DNA polymerase/3'-5' exonuclease PolX [Candidatus Aerophobetes bacterium]|uniref:DNA polymerase beta n=1 Tax=Aerophobetes bacterium TaxID=2030807 RepID=A0A662DFN6_UNCAE|nr:MAG: DNA polymerase/3'-5' exonuclease PolX [Candidatus Aerophobetes bacterium]